jgi:hypothetical protein
MLVKLLLLAAACCTAASVLVAFLAWRAWRRLRASLRVQQRLRAVRVWVTPPGIRREVAALRRELAETVGATPHAVAVVQRATGSVGELPILTRRLQRVAGTLDAELQLLANEPDAGEVARLLPPARARVDDVGRVARSIRRAAAAGLGAEHTAGVRMLSADVEREVTALALGVETLVALAADRPVARSA